jgi:multidrug efflux pump subunit AcrA (membrane-fusion protein)
MGLGTRLGTRLGRLRPRRLGRRGVIGVVVVLLAAAGVGGWLLTRPSNAAAAESITATVGTGTFQQTVAATGTVQPARQADLDFAVSGRVTAVRVAAGDKVEKGAVLARLDRTSLDAALTSAEAQLDAAQAQYDDDVDADASDTQLAADSAAVAAAESGLSQAQDDLQSATLTATMSGTVASVDLTVGDQVSGSSDSADPSAAADGSDASTTASQVVVVSPRRFEVEVDVSADDVTSVKKGMQAQVTPSGATEAVFGTVASVGLVAEANSSGAATFPVTVTITGPQSKLYAGTSATVSIITKQVTDVLSVPTMALHTSGHTSGATTYVQKLVKGKKVKTPVKVGETYGASTEVTSGLTAGDKVVVTTVRLPTGNDNRTGNRNGNNFDLPAGGGGGPPGGPDGGTFVTKP